MTRRRNHPFVARMANFFIDMNARLVKPCWADNTPVCPATTHPTPTGIGRTIGKDLQAEKPHPHLDNPKAKALTVHREEARTITAFIGMCGRCRDTAIAGRTDRRIKPDATIHSCKGRSSLLTVTCSIRSAIQYTSLYSLSNT